MIEDDKHGNAQDGPSYPADAQRLQSYANAEQQLAQFPAPLLYRAGDPHNRLYFACMDGTSNDESKLPFSPKTNVAKIKIHTVATHTNSIQVAPVPVPAW